MPQHRLAVLRADIARDLDNVRRLAAEAEEWGSKLADWPDTVRLRTAGGILQDFYSRVERVFRHIAVRIDDNLPDGPDWPVQLLQRMATDIETVRPAILDGEMVQQLEEYLRFRDLFRNISGFDLEWEHCRELLEDLPAAFERLALQFAAFDEFLQTLEGEL